MREKIAIGYVCSRGHHCFYADPGEAGQCRPKRVGTIWAEADFASGDMPEPFEVYVNEANDSLREGWFAR